MDQGLNWRNPYRDEHNHPFTTYQQSGGRDDEELDEPCEGCLYNGFEAGISAILEALKEIAEYRQGLFMARFPEDANMAVIYKERLPNLFISKEK